MRRGQLLDVAMAIVRDRGADELTLVSLAAAAGVSRPVAYDHFSTRAGLLLALFQQLEDRHVRALRDALLGAPAQLHSVAAVISDAYLNCLAELGPEASALSAALKGSDEMAAWQRLMMAEYVEMMGAALRPFSTLGEAELNLLCVGLLGAAEAIAREMQCGRVTEPEAAAALSSLITQSVDARAAGAPGERRKRTR
ncbi:MAG TPA: helix-turn-helix domain-containing protein [Ramlibacter sp.]|nr:helix-turn-helix domain-containing protein [Ramlibacter sp.]